MRRMLRSAAALSVIFAAPVAAQEGIDFDGTGAPCIFAEASPLTDLYAASGVTFSGNGEILNQCGNFSVSTARSGTDFLAFNSSVTGLPATETLLFSSPVSFFSIWVAATSSLSYTIYPADAGFGPTGFTGPMNPSVWTQIQFAAPSADLYFDRVVLTGSGVMVLDDLEFMPQQPSEVVPEPATMTLLATGLAALGAHRRRRRTN